MKEPIYNDVLPKFRNHSNYVLSDCDKEVNNEPSITIPDESFTVKEILERFTKGIPLNISQTPMYDNIDDYDAVDETRDGAFDLADATMAVNTLQTSFAEAREKKGARGKKKAESDTTAEDTSQAEGGTPEA